ncbi:unnamed protein product [Spirodela intermedia]|uniref:Uncharacterized protein n=1 Tax=Spirodela intermedia TaxID=51605 RepID=A0A7I8K670_SPIIN|nr:unnamed protein product [Spirodela intermedia]
MGCRVVSGGCHLTEQKKWQLCGSLAAVATRLLADRPLPDDGLFMCERTSLISIIWEMCERALPSNSLGRCVRSKGAAT